MTPTERLFEGAKAKIEMYVDLISQGRPTESPIEDLLFKAMLAHMIIEGQMANIKITRQFELSEGLSVPARVDFLVVDQATGAKCIVEADGHDFHERTKEQAFKDRSRDRNMQAMGYLVQRFTGSEIYRDPWRCAEQLFENIGNFAQSMVSKD